MNVLYALVALFLFCTVPVLALDLEFSQLKTDEQEQWSLHGRNSMNWHALGIRSNGRYIKTNSRDAQYELRNRVQVKTSALTFLEGGSGFYHTHKSAEGSVGLTLKSDTGEIQMRAGGNTEWVVGGHQDHLIRFGVSMTRKAKLMKNRYESSSALDYVTGGDGTMRLDASTVFKLWLHTRLYVGFQFRRIRNVDTQTSFIGLQLF